MLSSDGGALKQMLPAFKFGLGGIMGSGEQWMSWIHIKDLLSIIENIMNNEEFSGPINATSPNPVSNKEFTKTLARVLKRPAIIPIPGFLLRLLFGQMAKSLLLSGQKVVPKKMQDANFKFNYTELELALKDILQ